MSITNARHSGAGLLLEGAVILVSILAAFFLEGWRSDRELARDLARELTSVQQELHRNQDLVLAEIAVIDRLVSGGAALVAMTDSADGRARIIVPDTLVWLSTGWNVSFTPSLGAVDALIASGRLAQIENPQLRQGLAGLKDVFNDAFEEEVFAREISVGQIVPLIGARVPLDFRIGREFFSSGGEGLTPQERASGHSLTSYGTVEFPTDLAVRNAIVYRLAWLSAARSEFDNTHAHLADLITIVAAEIGASNTGRPRE